jgi:hypothetical protein
MTAGSCTLDVVEGHSLLWKFFGYSDEAEDHIEAQRRVIESNNLTGKYLVVKCGAPSDMADCLNNLMNFVGTDDVRVIVTPMDALFPHRTPLNEARMIICLSNLIGVAVSNTLPLRKDMDASSFDTLFYCRSHLPRQLRIDEEQLHYTAYLTGGARRFNLNFGAAKEKLDAALQAVRLLTTHFGSDLTLLVKTRGIQDELIRLVESQLREIKRKAEDIPPEVQNSLRVEVAESIQPSLDELRNIIIAHTMLPPSLDTRTSSGAHGKGKIESSTHHSANERYKNSNARICSLWLDGSKIHGDLLN